MLENTECSHGKNENGDPRLPVRGFHPGPSNRCEKMPSIKVFQERNSCNDFKNIYPTAPLRGQHPSPSFVCEESPDRIYFGLNCGNFKNILKAPVSGCLVLFAVAQK
jgi:hypothetical protein